jgi:peptidyl-prolyl cis-trans isomerase D
MKKAVLIFLLISLFILGGQWKNADAALEAKTAAGSVESKSEPDRVEVQHILIAFKGTIPDEKVTRNREEAESLARDLFARAKAEEDFDALVKEYTDDQHPGIYRMSNLGIKPDASGNEFPRERMVKSFGDVSFSLKVGEVGMALYDPDSSKYGWHIIKRLK